MKTIGEMTNKINHKRTTEINHEINQESFMKNIFLYHLVIFNLKFIDYLFLFNFQRSVMKQKGRILFSNVTKSLK